MSSSGESHIQKLVGWYRSHVKPLLTKTESQKGEEFDRDSDRLEAREKRLSEEAPRFAFWETPESAKALSSMH